MKDATGLIVCADGYCDEASHFNSASYLDESSLDIIEEPLHLRGTTSTTWATCQKIHLVQVAQNEVGYLEKASNAFLNDITANAGTANYTKYGAWYGINPGAWCAMFVSWCANQSSISTAVIPKYASCTAGKNTFASWGVYHPRSSSYTPSVGDIFFTGTSTDIQHTGIVTSVSTTSFNVVDGNCENKVNSHSYSLTNTSVLGFAHPNYSHLSPYQYNAAYHWNTCADCGTVIQALSAHQFIPQSTYYVCSVCGYTTKHPVYPDKDFPVFQ